MSETLHPDRTVAAPRVSVITPMFNTAAYVRECIESVLAQTFDEFEYVLLDNRSTDGTLEIAREYARKDRRIRLVEADRHLPQIPNFNRAVDQLSGESRYCKFVLSDDWLYPDCLERMVVVAERDPSIAMVGSYYLEGDRLRGAGLPYVREVFEGREVCRRQLLEGTFFFGSPTTVLYRSEALRSRPDAFDPAALHADTELAYELLETMKFGFVHQVLSYARLDDASTSGRVRNLAPAGLDKLVVLSRFGSRFLTDAEFTQVLRGHERKYYRSYAAALLEGGGSALVDHHRRGHERGGYRLSKTRLWAAVGRAFAERALSPGWWLAKVRGRR